MLYDHVRTDFGLKALSGVSINWRTKDNRPPKDVPACGFRGDLAVCTPIDVSGKLDGNSSKNQNERKSRHGNPYINRRKLFHETFVKLFFYRTKAKR